MSMECTHEFSTYHLENQNKLYTVFQNTALRFVEQYIIHIYIIYIILSLSFQLAHLSVKNSLELRDMGEVTEKYKKRDPIVKMVMALTTVSQPLGLNILSI